MRYDIKIRLYKLGKTQKDLIVALRGKSIKCSPAEISTYINGIVQTPKAELALAETDKLLSEWEEKTNANT